MELSKAIEILKQHQKWRLGKIDDMPFKPLEITEALDILLHVVDQKHRCNYCEKDSTSPIIVCKECTE